jgi:hypothetical protein
MKNKNSRKEKLVFLAFIISIFFLTGNRRDHPFQKSHEEMGSVEDTTAPAPITTFQKRAIELFPEIENFYNTEFLTDTFKRKSGCLYSAMRRIVLSDSSHEFIRITPNPPKKQSYEIEYEISRSNMNKKGEYNFVRFVLTRDSMRNIIKYVEIVGERLVSNTEGIPQYEKKEIDKETILHVLTRLKEINKK